MAPPSDTDQFLIEAEFVDHSQHDGSERLGDLDGTDVTDPDAAVGSGGAGQQPPHGRCRTEPGEVRLAGGDGRTDDPQVRQAGR